MSRSRSEAARAGWETRRANEAALSERSHKGWETRWLRAYESGASVGAKGREFLEQKFGPVVGGGRGSSGAGGVGRGGGSGGYGAVFDDEFYDDNFPDYDYFDMYDEEGDY